MSGWRRAAAAAALAALVPAGPASPQVTGPGAERLRTAKALFFDRQYAEARAAWADILARSRGAEADTAAYWVARCSESLGEHERAFREYGEFLARRPADRTLALEARTSRIGLAGRLVRRGQEQYLSKLHEGLSDPGKTVRYLAALELATLGRPECERGVATLKEILAGEKDEELVERAKLGLFRCDPDALARPEAKAPPSTRAERAGPPRARWLRVRIYERGAGQPKVSINIPMALAEILFKSLPDEAQRQLQRRGYHADNFWERLRELGPSKILEIEGDGEERIQIWLE